MNRYKSSLRSLVGGIFVLSLLSCDNSNNASGNQQTQLPDSAAHTVLAGDSTPARNTTYTIQPKNLGLPLGSKSILYKYPEVGSSNGFSSQQDLEYEKMLDFYHNLETPVLNNTVIDELYHPQELYSFDIDYAPVLKLPGEARKNGKFMCVGKLPDLGANKVLIYKSTEADWFNNDERMDIVVIDDRMKIINTLNIYHHHDGKYRYKKFFYIDKDYILHVKYFAEAEGPLFLINYIKYKLLSDGSIIRYFNQERGTYESLVEKGVIENHTKVREWKERFGEYRSSFEEEDAKKPTITFQGVYAVSNYQKGRSVGEQVFYQSTDLDYNSGQRVLRLDTRNGKVLEESLPPTNDE